MCDTSGPPPLGVLPLDLQGGEGRRRKGNGRERERGEGGKGKGGEGKGREGEVCIIAVGGIDAPE